MMRNVATEISIKDLACLAVPVKSARSSKNLNDTFKTASTAQSSLSSCSENIFDMTPICDNNNSTGMNWSGNSLSMDESANSSFSDLAKERSFDNSKNSFESDVSDTTFDDNGYHASFSASNGSLQWDDDEVFPKPKQGSARRRNSVDVAEFVVLSAAQAEQKGREDVGEEEEDFSDDDEEYWNGGEIPFESDHTGLAPSPRDNKLKRGDNRRSSALKQSFYLEKSPEDQAAEAAICQHLTRTILDGKSPRRGRGRQRSYTHKPSQLLRLDSNRSSMTDSNRSSATEGDAGALKQARLRSLSRTRNSHGAPHSRSSSVARHHGRDRSVSRDRSTATASAGNLEIKLEKPLLGKALGDESDEDEENPWDCPWFDKFNASKSADVPLMVPVKELTVQRTADKARDAGEVPSSMRRFMDTSEKSGASKSGKRDCRRRASTNEERQCKPTSANRTRRSLRLTTSAKERAPTKRSSLNDCSSRSNPEQRASLGERLSHLRDSSAQSTPERRTRSISGDETDVVVAHEHRRRPSDTKPTKPRRTRSSQTKGTAQVPTLSSMLEATR